MKISRPSDFGFSARLVLCLTLTLAIPAFLAKPADAASPPRLSPMATVSQTVGLSSVEITYNRPSARGREIFGGLVPYDRLWRTGANEATTLTISHDAVVAGQSVAAGSYSLFTIPGEDSWTLILNSQTDLWGARNYDESQDAIRAQLTPESAPSAEMMTFSVPSVTADSDGAYAATVRLHWAETAVQFPIVFGADVLLGVARADVEAALGSEDAKLAPAISWTLHFAGQRIALGEAESWARRMAERENESFEHQALYARLLGLNGKSADAVAQAELALELVPEDPYPHIMSNADELRTEMAAWESNEMR